MMLRHIPLVPLLALGACSSIPAAMPTRDEVSAALASKDGALEHEDDASVGFRLPFDTRPVEYALHFDIDPTQESFAGTAKITVRLDNARRAIFLHARKLAVTRATVNGALARFTQVDDDGLARLSFDAPVGPGDVDVELAWTAKYNEALESVYRVQSEGHWYVFTQFEAIMARESFPCFDEPGFKAPVTLSFTTRKEDVVVANTYVASQKTAGERQVTTFKRTQPLPVYLLAFAVGALEIVDGKPLPPTAVRNEPVPLRGITTKGHGKDLGVSLDVTLKALASLEKYFGIAYPYGTLDIVAVPDFSAGAMENAGLVTFRDVLLFVDDKSPIGLQKSNVHVIAHELAHQWFGDLVTLAWWDDIWLNEAFATWAQTFVVDEIRPDLNALVDARASTDRVQGEDSLVSARQIRQPVLSKGDIINAFDNITYAKGASVIAMFESFMGTERFRAAVHEYLVQHRHGTATAADLLSELSATYGRDIGTPFSTFLDQPGVPFVQANVVCDAKAKTATVELAQSRYLPVGSTGDRSKAWQVPVCVKADGKTSCTLLASTQGSLALATCPKIVVPNADGLGYYRWSLPGDQLKVVSSSLKTLSAGDRISFANAVRAGVWTAAISFEDALTAALPLARDVEPSVAKTPFWLLSFAWSELVQEAARPVVLKGLADAYRPVLYEVKLTPKPTDDPRVRERRTLALAALLHAEDASVTGELAKLGSAVLGLTDEQRGGKLRLDKAPADLVGPAIGAAIERGGEPVWTEAASMLTKETDSLARFYLLGGLGSVKDLALGRRALELALDPRLKVNEVMSSIWEQVGDVRTRDAAYAFVREHFDALLARLPESAGGETAPWIVGGGCDEDAAKSLDEFITPRKAKLPGVERALAQSLEEIRLCAAKKAAHVDSARKLFPVKR